MSFLFGGKEQEIPKPQPSKEAEEAAAAEAARRRQGAGYRSTILSDMAAGNLKQTFGA